MVSPMASTCNHYAAGCTKKARKFCGSKESKNSETHPEKPKMGKTRCVLGAGGSGSGWERMKTGGKAQCLNQCEPHNHATHEKRKPAKTLGFRRFCGRGRRIWSAPPLRSARSLRATGTHSPLGTRFWGGSGSAPKEMGKVQCCQVFPAKVQKEGAILMLWGNSRPSKSGQITFFRGLSTTGQDSQISQRPKLIQAVGSRFPN